MVLGNPKVAEELIGEVKDKYKPLLYLICNEVLEIYKDFANNTEYPATVAKSRVNQFNAYIEAGFTADQAMALLTNDIKQLKETINKSTANVGKN